MRLPRTDLIPVLAIIAGGVIGVFAFAVLAASSPSDEALALALLDEDGSLRNGVTGNWVLSVNLGRAGSGNARFSLEQDGNTVTGTYSGGMGRDIAVNGTVEDGTVKLFFDSDQGVIAYEGTIEGLSMRGTCVYGELGEGTFAGRVRG